MTAVPFVDFKAHVAALRPELDAAIARVLDSGWFILGPEGEAFEKELAQALGAADGQVLNLGDTHPISLIDLVTLLLDVAGGGSYKLVPFPPERKRIDIGDFYADISLVQKTLGWAPRKALRDGLAETVAYYRRHKEHYL